MSFEDVVAFYKSGTEYFLTFRKIEIKVMTWRQLKDKLKKFKIIKLFICLPRF